MRQIKEQEMQLKEDIETDKKIAAWNSMESSESDENNSDSEEGLSGSEDVSEIEIEINETLEMYKYVDKFGQNTNLKLENEALARMALHFREFDIGEMSI
jgi:hypothetical protein